MASSVPLPQANTTFCLDLFKLLSDKDKTANVFFSSFSISSALAMVMLGARGNTAAQMSEVLRFMEAEKQQPAGAQQQQMSVQMQMPKKMRQCQKAKCDQVDIHTEFNQLLSELNKPNAPYALSVANRLYGEKSYTFVKDFLKETRKYYNAELETVDFRKNSEAARLNINSWVEKQTQDKIKDLLVKDAVNKYTKMVLVNAIYFKGIWMEQFDEDATKDAQFRLNKTDTKPVKMMHLNETFPYTFVPDLNFHILELRYKGEELSMLIFLPRDIEDSSTGLEQLEKKLTYENFMEWTSPHKLTDTDVQVGLPRFKLEEKYEMKEVLVSMGMVDAFDAEKSDFSGMSPANDLVLSEVIHKAFVEVNEEGTEAAAATTVVTVVITAIQPRVTFMADHPFLFFIRHNPSNSILFTGRYCSPE